MDDLFLIGQNIGKFIEPRFNDLDIENYDIVLVNGPLRKAQDVIKALLTGQGNNLIYPAYGTLLGLGQVPRSTTDRNNLISDSVKEGIAWLQQQETSTDPSERIQSIKSLSVSPGASSSEVQINLVVLLETGEPVKTSFPVPA
jgi:hypothetical protein